MSLLHCLWVDISCSHLLNCWKRMSVCFLFYQIELVVDNISMRSYRFWWFSFNNDWNYFWTNGGLRCERRPFRFIAKDLLELLVLMFFKLRLIKIPLFYLSWVVRTETLKKTKLWPIRSNLINWTNSLFNNSSGLQCYNNWEKRMRKIEAPSYS